MALRLIEMVFWEKDSGAVRELLKKHDAACDDGRLRHYLSCKLLANQSRHKGADVSGDLWRSACSFSPPSRPKRRHVRTARPMWFSMMLDDEPAYLCSIARSRSACDFGSGFGCARAGASLKLMESIC